MDSLKPIQNILLPIAQVTLHVGVVLREEEKTYGTAASTVYLRVRVCSCVHLCVCVGPCVCGGVNREGGREEEWLGYKGGKQT